MARQKRKSSLLRVMVDANILISGTGWPRFSFEVLQHALHGDFQLVLSPYVINEAQTHIADLFPRELPSFKRFIELSRYEVAANPSKRQLATYAHLVPRDPSDLPVALAAIKARVHCLVSEDKHLTAQDESTEELRKRLKVYLAGTFLRELMGWSSDDLEVIRKRTWSDLSER